MSEYETRKLPEMMKYDSRREEDGSIRKRPNMLRAGEARQDAQGLSPHRDEVLHRVATNSVPALTCRRDRFKVRGSVPTVPVMVLGSVLTVVLNVLPAVVAA